MLSMVLLFLTVGDHVSYATDNLFEKITVERIGNHLPGLMVIISHNGETVFSETMGIADDAKGRSLDLNQSVMQTGSLSKVITSLGLIQAMSSNGIEMSDEISPYLPEYLSGHHTISALTFEQVLTHTTGIPLIRANSAIEAYPFEKKVRGFSEEAEAFFNSYKNHAVAPPGEFVLVSNVNSMLAGVLIETISGKTYEQFIAAQVLSNYGMLDSLQIIKRSVDYRERLVQNYSVFGGRKTPLEPFTTKQLPSEDFLTTGRDIEKLLHHLTQVSKGTFLYEALYQPSAYVNNLSTGRSAAFSVLDYGQHQVFLQDGGIPGANSRLLVVPDLQLSAFIYFNSNNLNARDLITELILEHYGVQANETKQFMPYEHPSLSNFIGVYAPLNVTDETVERLSKVIHQVRVSDVFEGISIDQVIYTPVSDTMFYSELNNRMVTFQVSDSGNILSMTLGNTVYTRAPIYQSLLIEGTILIFMAILNVLVLLICLFKWQDMRVHRIHDTPRVIILIHAVATTGVLFMIFLVSTQYNFWDVVYDKVSIFTLLKFAGWINLLIVIPTHLMIRRVKDDFRWTWPMKFTIRAHWLLAVALAVWMWRYNLI